MAAYFVGVRYGRAKLNPVISPKKTIEGAFGGLAGSLLTAVVIYLLAGILGLSQFPFWHFVVIGLVGGLAGQIGDLFASMVKRHCGVKDFGSIFPGHGGMMATGRIPSSLSPCLSISITIIPECQQSMVQAERLLCVPSVF